MSEQMQNWELWYPQAAATGMLFGRSRIAAGADILLIHAAPQVLTVLVRGADGRVLAAGRDLATTADTPIARLTRHGDQIERVDIWPDTDDIGRVVLLAGGEAGVLTHWWHAADHSEWRWQLELYNHR